MILIIVWIIEKPTIIFTPGLINCLIIKSKFMQRQLFNHNVQSVNINAPVSKVFNYIANPQNLPGWTAAFKEADNKSALLATPAGELAIGLETRINAESGTIDWYMTMPDGNTGAAYSRVVEGPDQKAIYTFILLAPPGPIEKVEGALREQMGLLANELQNLKRILEK
jgi:hypothetical protein